MKKLFSSLSDEVPTSEKGICIKTSKAGIQEKLHKTVHNIREINEKLVLTCSELKRDQSRLCLKCESGWSNRNTNSFINFIYSHNIEKFNQYIIAFLK